MLTTTNAPQMVLRIKKGRKVTETPIETVNQASIAQRAAFDAMLNSGGSPSDLPEFLIVVDGKARGYVSQNGKVWEGSPRDPWTSDRKPLFDPYAEVAL